MPPPPRTALQLLAAQLAGSPGELTRAACRGRAPLFDADVPGETPDQRTDRVADAAALCAGCPARAACAQLATDAPAHEVAGVWAGRLHEPARAPRQCRWCSLATTGPALYCSPDCRQAAREAATTNRAPRPRWPVPSSGWCVWCGRTITHQRTSGRQPLHCSPACRRARRRALRAA